MNSKNLIINTICFIFLSIITYVYICCNNSFITTPDGTVYTDAWDRIFLTPKIKEDINFFLSTDIFTFDDGTISDTAKIYISVSERHHRVTGTLEITGTFVDILSIEKLFNDLNLITSTNRLNSILEFFPTEINMKDMCGYINQKEKTFEINLMEDLLLNPTGLDIKLHNVELHKIFSEANKKQLKNIRNLFLKIEFINLFILIFLTVLSKNVKRLFVNFNK